MGTLLPKLTHPTSPPSLNCCRLKVCKTRCKLSNWARYLVQIQLFISQNVQGAPQKSYFFSISNPAIVDSLIIFFPQKEIFFSKFNFYFQKCTGCPPKCYFLSALQFLIPTLISFFFLFFFQKRGIFFFFFFLQPLISYEHLNSYPYEWQPRIICREKERLCSLQSFKGSPCVLWACDLNNWSSSFPLFQTLPLSPFSFLPSLLSLLFPSLLLPSSEYCFSLCRFLSRERICFYPFVFLRTISCRVNIIKVKYRMTFGVRTRFPHHVEYRL